MSAHQTSTAPQATTHVAPAPTNAARYAEIAATPGAVDRIVDALRGHSYFVLHDYLDPVRCAALRERIDAAIVERPDVVRVDSDMRLFCAEVLDDAIESFRGDRLLSAVGTQLVGEEQRALLAMANRLEQVEGKPRRSGGDWHRDRYAPQYKAMLYLSDVGPENGPFSLFPGSDGVWPYAKTCREIGFDYLGQRWDEAAFSPFLEAFRDRLRVLTASAGTVILFNSSTIHSGQPIQSGRRYAITNYYYSLGEIDIKKMSKKFVRTLKTLAMPSH